MCGELVNVCQPSAERLSALQVCLTSQTTDHARFFAVPCVVVPVRDVLAAPHTVLLCLLHGSRSMQRRRSVVDGALQGVSAVRLCWLR